MIKLTQQDIDWEKNRHECEVREWIKRGYTTRSRLAELKMRLTEKRSKASAEKVVADIIRVLQSRKP